MRHHFNRCAAATCTVVLVASACSDITEPPAAGRAHDPNFSHGGPSETICTTGFVAGEHDNVTVPRGMTCTIAGATVRGNVKALEDSRVFVQLSEVRGNIEGDRPALIQIFDRSTVGNIFVTGAKGDPAPGFTTVSVFGGVMVTGGDVHILKSNANGIFIDDITVEKGSIKVEDNTVSLGFDVTRNRVAQNVQVYKNQGGLRKEVMANTAGESVQCFDNGPPFTGGPNVAPKREGQCF